MANRWVHLDVFERLRGGQARASEGAPPEDEAAKASGSWLADGTSSPAPSQGVAPRPGATAPEASARWMTVAEQALALPKTPEPESRAPRRASSWLTATAGSSAPGTDDADRRPAEDQAPEGIGEGRSSGRWLEQQAGRRRTRAVQAYCTALLPAADATSAASYVLGAFADEGDEELLRSIRAFAASHAKPGAQLKGWRRLVAGESPCDETPASLAARENGELGADDSQRLERHLAGCLVCQATELRMSRAERAFAGITGLAAASFSVKHAIDGDDGAAAAAGSASAAEAEVTAPAADEAGPAAAPAPDPVSAATGGQPERETLDMRAAPAAAPFGRLGRRATLALVAAAIAVLAGAGLAAALVTSGSPTHRAASTGASVPAVSTTPAVPATTTPTPKRAASAHKRRPAHRAAVRTPAAANNPTPTQTQAATTPGASSSAPAQTTASSSPPTSTGSATAPAPQPNPVPSSPQAPSVSAAPAPPSTSIQQPSLGATSAPQGLGKGK